MCYVKISSVFKCPRAMRTVHRASVRIQNTPYVNLENKSKVKFELT